MPGSFSRSTYSEDRHPMPSPNVRILTEKLADQRFLGAIFLGEESLGLIEIIPCLTSSAAVSGAMTMLSNDPERPIAVVINADTEEPREVKTIRGSAWRLLAQVTDGDENWHVALAVPRVDAWVLADPRIAQAFQAEEATRTRRSAQAERIGELARQAPLDREAIGRAHPGFAALAAFIKRLAPVPEPAT
jgi:hypothetical protein